MSLITLRTFLDALNLDIVRFAPRVKYTAPTTLIVGFLFGADEGRMIVSHTRDGNCPSPATRCTPPAGLKLKAHKAVRPVDYPPIADLEAGQVDPENPPFCTICGHEMLIFGDLAQRDQPEWHAIGDLNP